MSKHYIKITSKDKTNIRKRYEAGEDLITLALRFHVNYGTLRNVASSEKWVKGKLNEIIYLKEIEKDCSTRNKFLQSKKTTIDNLLSHEINRMTQDVKDFKQDKVYSKLNAKEEIARNFKVKSIADVWKLEKELHGILDRAEELEYQERILKLEKAQREIEEADDVVNI